MALLIAVGAQAQPAVLVKDIHSSGSSGPASLIELNGRVLFTANDGVNGVELWSSDGTPGGTMMLKDIAPGSASSSPGELSRANGLVFFAADDGVGPRALWKTDGTPGGTVLVSDLVADPGPVVGYNGARYFGAPSGLWRIDASASNPTLVQGLSFVSRLTAAHGLLFFTVGQTVPNPCGSAVYLWRTDGTPGGTAQVFGPAHSFHSLTNFGWLYFYRWDADCQLVRSSLRRTDRFQESVVVGLEAPTYSVDPLPVVAGSLFHRYVDPVSLWNNGLYRVDSPTAASQRVSSYVPVGLTGANGALFYFAKRSSGWDLWRLDAVSGQSAFVKFFPAARALKGVNGSLFLYADDGIHGLEPWLSDGTPEGTQMVQDISPGAPSSGAAVSGSFSGSQVAVGLAGVFFWADDGITGTELWLLPTASLPIPSATTIGVDRPSDSTWYLRDSNTSGYGDAEPVYGDPADVPIVGDYDGDGVDTIGVYRPSEHTWYLRNSNSSGFNDIPAILYGADGDVPLMGDWDGDGTETIGVYRPSEHAWYLRNSNSSGFNDVPLILYGADGDVPVVGDWDGDGIDTIGVYRPSEHAWYLRNSNTSGPNEIPAILYGVDGDVPTVGDWNGDGTDTIGVYRPSEHVWYLRDFNSSGSNTIPAIFYGVSGDKPVVGNWNGR